MWDIFLPYNCTYDERLSNPNCFVHKEIYGLNLVQEWNTYCSKCIHGNKNVGICVVNRKIKPAFQFSNGFSAQKEYIIQCKKQADVEYIANFLNPLAEKIYFYHGEIEDFSFLEKFHYLSHLRISSSRCTHLSWDIHKTPNLSHLSVEGKRLFDISALANANKLRNFQFTIATSRTDRQDIQSLSPLSQLPLLERVEIQGARLQDETIDHLISIPNLKCLFVSPNTYCMDDFAKFEAQKFKIGERYGIYREDKEGIFCYGKDVRPWYISREKEVKIKEYLEKYYTAMEKYK